MKTDRELLGLAAKAAGLQMCEEWDCAADGDGILIGIGNGDLKPWNPLADDGDALRLAVDLKLEIERSKYNDSTVYVGAVDSAPWKEEACAEFDIYAATRRAIVRAAADIGEQMQ